MSVTRWRLPPTGYMIRMVVMARQWDTNDGIIHVGNISVVDIATRHDTPCYVTDGNRIRECCYKLVKAWEPYSPVTIAYAVKANSTLAILALLAYAGMSFDIVSTEEMEMVTSVGVKPENIFFTGTSVRDDEIARLLTAGVELNIDSLSMAKRIASLPIPPRSFGVRVNPGIGAGHHEHVITGSKETKFGVAALDIPKVCSILAKNHGHRVSRIHVHLGSGIMDAEPFLSAIDVLHRIISSLNKLPNVEISAIDLGGGWGIAYRDDEPDLQLSDMTKKIGDHFRKTFGDEMQLILEPGRYLVADSTLLLTRINTIKPTQHTCFAGIDAGFNVLLRPLLYGAYHRIVAAERMNQTPETRYTICGPICESGDILGEQRLFPKLQEGDLLALLDTGAYGNVMSSNYNSRTRPTEIIIINETETVMRKRETIADLQRNQIIPDCLQPGGS